MVISIECPFYHNKGIQLPSFIKSTDELFGRSNNELIYAEHDYKGNTVSTVKEEKSFRPRLNTAIDVAEFVAFTDELNLA